MSILDNKSYCRDNVKIYVWIDVILLVGSRLFWDQGCQLQSSEETKRNS